jgi:Divergent InlB B-repeat domain
VARVAYCDGGSSYVGKDVAEAITSTTATLVAHLATQGCVVTFSFVLDGPSGSTETPAHRFFVPGAGEGTEVYKLPVTGLAPGAIYTVRGKTTVAGVPWTLGQGPQKFQTLARLDVFLRGSGTVASSSPGIDCGTVCGEDLPIGTGVEITATPSAGYRFGHWEGDACSGTSPKCTAWVLNWVRTTAVFDQADLVTVTRGGSGSGSVSSTPAGLACGAGCSATFDPGQSVTLTATPDAGSRFGGWSGACTGAGQTCSFETVVGTQAVQAAFVKLATLTVHRTGRGKVRDDAGKIDCGTTCAATVDDGTTTTLHAKPTRGFRFVRWGGACSGRALACTVTVTGSQDVTAAFKKKPRKKSRP